MESQKITRLPTEEPNGRRWRQLSTSWVAPTNPVVWLEFGNSCRKEAFRSGLKDPDLIARA